MLPIGPQVVLAIDAERIPRDLEARLALARSRPAGDRPHPLRRALGRTLLAVGSWLAAESPPHAARPS